MKILPVKQLREADAYTIMHEPVASIDLMERAAAACTEWIVRYLSSAPAKNIKIFCGPGNNGGDGLAIARLLAAKGFRPETYVLHFTEKASGDFRINEQRLSQTEHKKLFSVVEKTQLPVLSSADLVVDAILGSGLSKPLEGLLADTVHILNMSQAETIAIDVPSGLFCDESSVENRKHIVRATHTLSFELPKLAFMFPENAPFVGEWHILSIGISKKFIEDTETKNFLITSDVVSAFLKKRHRFDHKGVYGHALLIAGSSGKMGAAVLASEACLRAGSGLLTTHIPSCGYTVMQTAVPEAMVSLSEDEKVFAGKIKEMSYSAIAIGPGIGREEHTARALKIFIQQTDSPVLFDADAINILAENKTWLSFLPNGCVFTPHPKEFERLVGSSKNNFERMQMQVDFSKKYSAYVVLKGAHTMISCPDGSCFFNSTGNPGMATAGSGDVLTGMLLGLLAQGYNARQACLLGVYLHGLAGDLALADQSVESLIAGDIPSYLGKAFDLLREKRTLKQLSSPDAIPGEKIS